MATVFSYGGKPGAYLQLIGPKLKDNSQVNYIVPYASDFSFTASQETIQPVQELFQFLGETVNKAAGLVPVLGELKELESVIRTTFGLQFYNKLYYAQAWKGSKPISFSLNIPFNIGGLNQWNGATEVLEPINSIVRATLPFEESGTFMMSPMPNGLSVFTAYTSNIIDGIRTQLGAENVLGRSQSGTWQLQLGLLAENAQDFSRAPFLSLSQLIIKSATPSYSMTQLDSNGKPIKGSVTLAIESQTIPTSTIFGTR